MKSSSINRVTVAIFAYSLLIKVMVCFTQTFPQGAPEMAFPICLMVFTWMCIEEYKSDNYPPARIVMTILIGTLILTLPVRIVDFSGTIGSLYLEILGIMGIGIGWLLAYKRKIWLLLLSLLSFIIITNMWLNR